MFIPLNKKHFIYNIKLFWRCHGAGVVKEEDRIKKENKIFEKNYK